MGFIIMHGWDRCCSRRVYLVVAFTPHYPWIPPKRFGMLKRYLPGLTSLIAQYTNRGFSFTVITEFAYCVSGLTTCVNSLNLSILTRPLLCSWYRSVVLLRRVGSVNCLDQIKWFVTNRTESIDQLFEPITVFFKPNQLLNINIEKKMLFL